MALLKQSTAYTRTFKMISSTDHISPKPGAAPVLNISKAGGAFAAVGGAVTEMSNGWYKAALNTTDTNTLGDLSYYVTGTGADDTDFLDQVIALDLAIAGGAAGGLQIAGANAATTYATLTVTGAMTVSDGLAITRSSANTSAITATGNGTGSGAVFTSGAGATGDGIQATAGSTNGNGFALTKTGTGLALKGATTDLILAKTTNITGFNDLTAAGIATGVWTDTTAGDFTAALSVGKSVMNGVALGTGLTINAYTGNTPQTGDSFARIGAPAGASMSADVAAIQAKTVNLPAAPASTTNITAGTLTTVTNLTNLPAIPANWLTAAGMAADASEEIADTILGRNVSGGSNAGRTVKQALHFLRNKWTVIAGTLTVYDTDDTTPSWTSAVTGTAGADPITGTDPA